ncbi:MAG: hypothetical protein ACRDXD_15480 [Acidimicrobiia bacterium]
MAGLRPRTFVWVMAERLAVSERVGGYGVHHRRVRREEEVTWLKEAGINTVISLLAGNQNFASYRAAGFRIYHRPLVGEFEPEEVRLVFATIHEALSDPAAKVLLHRDIIDDTVAGVLAGYLMYAGLVTEPIVALAAIQQIIGRPMGPEGRRLLPVQTG